MVMGDPGAGGRRLDVSLDARRRSRRRFARVSVSRMVRSKIGHFAEIAVMAVTFCMRYDPTAIFGDQPMLT